jgi:Uma2 family endonuclease
MIKNLAKNSWFKHFLIYFETNKACEDNFRPTRIKVHYSDIRAIKCKQLNCKLHAIMVDTPRQRQTVTTQIPPLESGDRLTRHEFERRYAAMPHLKKAELIEGVIYVPAALRFRSHGQPQGDLITWLGVYRAFTPNIALGDNPTVRLDRENEPQPDAVLLIEERAGGQARLSDDDYVEGAPELVAEIAASSASIDLGDKKRAYRRNGRC